MGSWSSLVKIPGSGPGDPSPNLGDPTKPFSFMERKTLGKKKEGIICQSGPAVVYKRR